MRALGSSGCVATCLVTILLVAGPARADGPPTHADAPQNRAAAAAAFDEGVTRFDQADYAAAAQAFLRADALAPSTDAVTNALAAAKKASEYLLVVEAAERGVKRGATDPELATRSREALAEATRSLARLELTCEPSPCSLFVDGAATTAGNRYLLPGTHGVAATAADGNRTEEQLALIAGAAYTVVLHAVPRGQSAEAANVSTDVAGAPAREPSESAPKPEPEGKRADVKKPLPPAVFYVGVGVTVILAGVGIWSGVDTLSAKGKESRDDVYAKARRSDALWASALVVGGLTAASGFLWVEWGNSRSGGEKGGGSAGLTPVPGGALATAQGRF
jgi:hypothetical protein